MHENDLDILAVTEVDLADFDEKRPFSIEGYQTFFPLQRVGSTTKRMLCFVKDTIEVSQRSDLMSGLLSNVWLELRASNQKILICTIYREFNDLTGTGKMSVQEQCDRLGLLVDQFEKASKEGLVVCLGDLNIDLNKWDDCRYYMKKVAETYQMGLAKSGMEVVDFGITWRRVHADGRILESAIDHAATNKPEAIDNHFTVEIDYSDHELISLDLNVNVQKRSQEPIRSRDLRKLRSNPSYFLNALNKIDWSSLFEMLSVDQMEEFWTSEINKCLDEVAPWQERKRKKRKVVLPEEVKAAVQKRNKMKKQLKEIQGSGSVDRDFEMKFKKYNNYCNNLVKKAVRQISGKNITENSTVEEVWKSLGHVMRPETMAKKSMKIKEGNDIIEDPQTLTQISNKFFKKKVEDLAASIKKDPSVDPLGRLRQKYMGAGLEFSLKTVQVQDVLKIMKQLKTKKSAGFDGISAEILKLGAEVLAVPLTHIINTSIVSGVFPTNWKEAKVVPIHKKGDKRTLKNYRPVALLSVAGMILERVVAIQIEEHFENNRLFGDFQFGFRQNKSTISELLTLFENLLEAKEDRSFIMLLMYDLSAAFDTVSHDILCQKLRIYGFDNAAMKWVGSYLESRKQRVTISGKISDPVDINIGTPQGSRLSPLLFICLMADLELWTTSPLSNFADDTQSVIMEKSEEEAIETTRREANNVIGFFGGNNLVNNADKACLLYNKTGTASNIEIAGIGGENVSSKESEKLLGLHVSANLDWKVHIDKLSSELRARIGILRRLYHKLPRDKLFIVAEAIFNSKIRYGIAVYLKPTFEEEEIKSGHQYQATKQLQALQNEMLRTICGFRKKDKKNVQKLREKWLMMSVNQMSVYHTIIEAYNVIHKGSSETIREKMVNQGQECAYNLRSRANGVMLVPAKTRMSCQGFSYYAAKLYNKLPMNFRTANAASFKTLVKNWIWENIPSN